MEAQCNTFLSMFIQTCSNLGEYMFETKLIRLLKE